MKHFYAGSLSLAGLSPSLSLSLFSARVWLVDCEQTGAPTSWPWPIARHHILGSRGFRPPIWQPGPHAPPLPRTPLSHSAPLLSITPLSPIPNALKWGRWLTWDAKEHLRHDFLNVLMQRCYLDEANRRLSLAADGEDVHNKPCIQRSRDSCDWWSNRLSRAEVLKDLLYHYSISSSQPLVFLSAVLFQHSGSCHWEVSKGQEAKYGWADM